jgi:hypothetical protein
MERASDALANAELLDQQGNAHRAGELWAKRPAVVHFVRHFG